MQQQRNTTGMSLEQVRKTVLLNDIDPRTERGIEFGPLNRPLVTKDDGRILYIDYTTTDVLRARHAHRTDRDPAAIVDVDRVWNDALPKVLRDDLPLDYAVASHVIEHVPDLVGWLSEVAQVLRPGGRLCLTVPDKRYTFDFQRTPSRLTEAMSAHLQSLRRPSPQQVFDHYRKVVQLPLREAWQGRLDISNLSRIHDFDYALSQTRKAQNGEYVDCHCWVFTPRSFLDLLSELAEHGFLAYRLTSFQDTRPYTFEFYVCLECDQALPGDPDRRAEAAASFRRNRPAGQDSEPGDPSSRELLTKMQDLGRKLETADRLLRELQASLARAEQQIQSLQHANDASWCRQIMKRLRMRPTN
ncbi:methyltransferase domain-containing protein [Desulfocurvibacter africanus]|uniref:methyltransferase domain-containing protein n=1 Tax=Desulfocurvibacter africanus TaxID=873 RepID=UPI000684F262|nr:class I SAM-dependent methyltransferase [Desulfocurvibacter africanus]